MNSTIPQKCTAHKKLCYSTTATTCHDNRVHNTSWLHAYLHCSLTSSPDTCPQAPSHQLQPLARETLSPSGYTGIQTPQVPSKIKRKEKGKTWSRWRFLGRWDAQPALQDQPPNTRGYAGFSKWNQDLPSWLGSISQENSRSNDSLKPHRVYSFLL